MIKKNQNKTYFEGKFSYNEKMSVSAQILKTHFVKNFRNMGIKRLGFIKELQRVCKGSFCPPPPDRTRPWGGWHPRFAITRNVFRAILPCFFALSIISFAQYCCMMAKIHFNCKYFVSKSFDTLVSILSMTVTLPGMQSQ